MAPHWSARWLLRLSSTRKEEEKREFDCGTAHHCLRNGKQRRMKNGGKIEEAHLAPPSARLLRRSFSRGGEIAFVFGTNLFANFHQGSDTALDVALDVGQLARRHL